MLETKKLRKLHFIGIGGIGMSGIAEMFFNQGYPVSGSDQAGSEVVERLRQIGIQVALSHQAENLKDADVVVVSSAIRKDNPELLEARRRRLPVIPRAEMLGELMRNRTGIAVAGTHGKTTTTSMLASVLMSAGLDPTVVVGGRVNALGANAKLGKGQFVVAEADESDGSFLHLPATFAVVTNIDTDHMDHFESLNHLDAAFREFVSKVPFYGMVAACGDDPGVQRGIGQWTKPVVTYGFTEGVDYLAKSWQSAAMGSQFEIFKRDRRTDAYQKMGSVRLQVPGKHSALNSLAVIALSDQIGLEWPQIQKGLAEFRGVKRRFEVHWQDTVQQKVIMEDYGHHPTEVAATLSALRSFWKGRIITLFQPHRYSRTAFCRDGFLSCFRDADQVILLDIYSAGEEPIPGVDSRQLVSQIQAVAVEGQSIEYAATFEAAVKRITEDFRPGDLVLCLGAGSVTRLPTLLMQAMKT